MKLSCSQPGWQRPERACADTGVTLLELLVAMTVLALIVVLGGEMVNSSAKVSGSAMTRLALREEARGIFDRMELDFENLVRTHVYEVSTGNNRISLLTRLGPEAGRRLTRIDYNLNRVDGRGRLLRSMTEVGWNDLQELNTIDAGTGEVLSDSVGAIGWVGLFGDGSSDRGLDLPAARGDRPLSALVVLMALADPKSIATTATQAPQILETNEFPWFALPPGEEAKGWRLFSHTFSLP